MTANNIIEWLYQQEFDLSGVSPYLTRRKRSYREVLQDIVRKRILQRGRKHTSGWEE